VSIRKSPFSVGVQCCGALRETDAREQFLRRNYLLLQATHPDWMGRADITLRYTLNPDDASSRLLAFVEVDCRDRTRLFASGTAFAGGSDSEFGSVLKVDAMAGVDITF